MKHIPPDHAFIYYYERRLDKKFVGIRVSRSQAYVVEGDSSDPTKLVIQGEPEELPMHGEGSERFYAVREMLAASNLELERLLRSSHRQIRIRQQSPLGRHPHCNYTTRCLQV